MENYFLYALVYLNVNKTTTETIEFIEIIKVSISEYGTDYYINIESSMYSRKLDSSSIA
jgi:hypothetical protein